MKKQKYSVFISEPLYGTSFIQYVPVKLTGLIYDSGINQYSPAVITETLYCSGINHKTFLSFRGLRKVCKNYRTVSVSVTWNLVIVQETRIKHRTIFSPKKCGTFSKLFLYSPVIFNRVHL